MAYWLLRRPVSLPGWRARRPEHERCKIVEHIIRQAIAASDDLKNLENMLGQTSVKADGESALVTAGQNGNGDVFAFFATSNQA
jgi:hypothetical protein